jgi:integrase
MRRAGLRCSEISLLKFVDFTSLSQLRLSINFSKSAAGRRDLPLHILLSDLELQLFLDYYKPVFFASLSDLRVLYKPFIFDKNGILLSPEQIGAEVAKVIKAAGLELQTAHKLRHAFASSLLAAWWLRKTESKFTNSFRKDDWARQALHQFCRPEVEGRAITYLDDIRGLMGHASLDVTFDRYIHNVDLITADAVRAGEFLETPRKINVGLAANLAGVTTRELRRVIPAADREKSDLDKRMVEIDTEKFKNWLISRLQ